MTPATVVRSPPRLAAVVWLLQAAKAPGSCSRASMAGSRLALRRARGCALACPQSRPPSSGVASMTPQDLLAKHNIHLASTAPGRYYTTCPQCSAKRSKAHQRNKVLGVTVDANGAHWGCNHCGWTGPEKGHGTNGSGNGRASEPSHDLRLSGRGRHRHVPEGSRLRQGRRKVLLAAPARWQWRLDQRHRKRQHQGALSLARDRRGDRQRANRSRSSRARKTPTTYGASALPQPATPTARAMIKQASQSGRRTIASNCATPISSCSTTTTRPAMRMPIQRCDSRSVSPSACDASIWHSIGQNAAQGRRVRLARRRSQRRRTRGVDGARAGLCRHEQADEADAARRWRAGRSHRAGFFRAARRAAALRRGVE